DSIIRGRFAAPKVISEREFVSLSPGGKSSLDMQFSAVVDAKSLAVKAISLRSKFYSPDTKTFNFRTPQNLPDTIRYQVFEPTTGKPLLIGLPKISDELVKKFKREDDIAKKQLEIKIAALGRDTIKYSKNYNWLEDVAKEMNEKDIPLTQRINFASLENMLRKGFLNNNITQKYDVQVKLAQKDSVLYLQASNPGSAFLPDNTYRTTLFGNDLFRDPGILEVSFPNRNSAIVGNLSATLASSVGLLLVLVFIFSYTLYAILKQKKISEMKTDFINNMTHEFKTPVATIMIVLDSMSLQLQKKNAVLNINTDAENAVIFGDELHLSNVLYNLIDNANKYSKEIPEITISTKNIGKNLIIEIADNGIGMSKEHSKRIFDQFYRVPTGNLHDVKGFGLGLNYVQDIIKKLNGTIKVSSEKDRGTTFEISLPL
ncbi:MAG: sensor histidine kinase, partial [Chitinophagaceae bacterium]